MPNSPLEGSRGWRGLQGESEVCLDQQSIQKDNVVVMTQKNLEFLQHWLQLLFIVLFAGGVASMSTVCMEALGRQRPSPAVVG